MDNYGKISEIAFIPIDKAPDIKDIVGKSVSAPIEEVYEPTEEMVNVTLHFSKLKFKKKVAKMVKKLDRWEKIAQRRAMHKFQLQQKKKLT